VSTLVAGEDLELRFNIKAAGLQPYLGAWAHVAIAGERLSSFIHAHPLADGESPIRETEAHTHAAEAAGPAPSSLRVVTSFPYAGRYKMWVELQMAGKLETAPFVVYVANALQAHVQTPAIPRDAIRIRITPR